MRFIFLFFLLTFTNLYSDEFDYKIEEFILNNPEIILQSLKDYEKKKNDEAQVDFVRIVCVGKASSRPSSAKRLRMAKLMEVCVPRMSEPLVMR